MTRASRMTVFAPVGASSTLEETVSRLGTAIRVGVLAPGDRLPPERDLADQLRISRSTLRQALARLTETGHLTAVRGRSGGTFVAHDPPLATGSLRPPEGWRAFLDWRLALELGVAVLAAERARAEDRLLLADALQRLEDSADADWAAYRRADAAFHLCLAEAARSTRLVGEMTRLQGRLCDVLVSVDEDTRRAANEQHAAVLEAVAGGDCAGALAAMRDHLVATETILAAVNGG